MSPSADEIIDRMRQVAEPARLDGMARYGMNVEHRLGLKMPEIRALAKELGRNHQLALDLWGSGLHDARILATMVADPDQVTDDLMDDWVADFDSWDVCDQCCMNLFRRLPQAWTKIDEWARRDEEFVRRAAFALIATLAVHAKSEPDSRFIDLLCLVETHSEDNRNFVKKAVNWALRQIGKRNPASHSAAIATAHRIADRNSPSARWIAKDALRELHDEKTIARLRR